MIGLDTNVLVRFLVDSADEPARGIEVGDRDVVQRAIEVFEAQKGDFADHVIAAQAHAAGAALLYTFDRALHTLDGFAEP